jgi:transcriptional regulator with GAF, ATPase, and Fis domain
MAHPAPSSDPAQRSELVLQIARRAREQWGDSKPTLLIGRHPCLRETVERAVRLAASDQPALITGETGTGKELFARVIYLFSRRRHRPYLCVNCAQYGDGQLLASELFGHRKGAFTGAATDHRGIFETANGGVVVLDEVGELSPLAQAMLLRALSEGEIVPVGANEVHRVDVRVIAMTSRDLTRMVADGTFRPDLYYRLRYLHLQVPPLRERGDDWELITDHQLDRLSSTNGVHKTFSREAKAVLRDYCWPGNVREVLSVVDTAYCLSTGANIAEEDFAYLLTQQAACADTRAGFDAHEAVERMLSGESFWDVIYRPYMQRDINRTEAQAIIARGLRLTNGSYQKLLAACRIAPEDYLKCMDFLRHQRLKPTSDRARFPDGVVLQDQS